MADDRRSPLLWPTKTNKMCSAMSSARGGNTASTEEGLACGKKMVFPMKPFCRSAWGSTTGCRTVTCMHTRTRGKSRFVPAERERSSGKALPSHRSFARAWRGKVRTWAVRLVRQSRQTGDGCRASSGMRRRCKSTYSPGRKGCSTADFCNSSKAMWGQRSA